MKIKSILISLLILFTPVMLSSSELIPFSSGQMIAEDKDFVPVPASPSTLNSTRVAQTSYDGAAFYLWRPVSLNRIIFKITAFTSNGNVKILVYQASNGMGGTTASLKATIDLAIAASGVYAATPSEGTVDLSQGYIYILFGKNGGGFTFRTRSTQALDLFTADVDTDTFAGVFTTTIATNTSPATFNPKPTPGGEATPSTLDLVLGCRFKKL